MPRRPLVLRPVIAVLLTLAPLLVPGQTVAGPPEGVSGRMVFDEVGVGLDRYGREKDPAKRLAWLKRLAPTKDPRVAVALWDAQFTFGDELPSDEERCRNDVCDLLCQHFVRSTRFHHRDASGSELFEVGKWWEANEADLRRRAKELPPDGRHDEQMHKESNRPSPMVDCLQGLSLLH
jgi:hypothetical protein